MSLGMSFEHVIKLNPNVWSIEVWDVGLFRKRKRTFVLHFTSAEDLLFEMPGMRQCGFLLMLKVRKAARAMIAASVKEKVPT